MQEMWVLSLSGEDPLRRKWQPTPVFLPGKSHGQRSLVGYSPWGRKRVRHDLAMTTHVHTQVLARSGFRICSLVEFLSTQMERLWDDTEFMDSRVPLSPLDRKVTGKRWVMVQGWGHPMEAGQWEHEEMQLLPETPKYRAKERDSPASSCYRVLPAGLPPR